MLGKYQDKSNAIYFSVTPVSPGRQGDKVFNGINYIKKTEEMALFQKHEIFVKKYDIV